MCTHTYVSTHYFMFGACWGIPRLQRTFFIIITEVHGLMAKLWYSFEIPSVLRTISPCVTDSVLHTEDGVSGKFCYHLSTFCTINVAKTKPEPVLEKLCSSSSSALYHPFQHCTIPSSPPCWHFPFKHPYSCYMACTYSSQNKIISWVAV